jgi:hypothetical protein
MAISRQREEARAVFPADLQTVGSHTAVAVGPGSSTWLAKPDTATHVKLQALGADVRYRVDEGEANLTTGFQLADGADTLAPAPNRGVSVIGEAVGVVQYQWVR